MARWVVGAALGVALPVVAVALAVAFGVHRLQRTDRPARAPWWRGVRTIVVLSLIEELVFRVAVASAVAAVAGPVAGVAVSAVAFGAIHVVFGESVAERASSVVNATLFGVVVAIVWLTTRDVVAIVVFHVLYNVVGGMVLGWVGIDEIDARSEDSTPSWPFVVERTRKHAGWAVFATLVASECVPFAVALLAVVNLRTLA